jgi:hypothetical protein
METQRYDSLDFKRIQYSKPEKRGAFYYSDITYGASGSEKPLMILCPKLRTKISGSESLTKTSPTLELEPETNDFSFYDSLLKLDERNIKETYEKGKDWFGKEIPVDLIDDMYKRATKPLKRDQRPSFSFKIPMEKKEPRCKVFTGQRSPCSLTDVSEGAQVVTVLHIRGLKFLKQHYYCDYYVTQMQILGTKDPKFLIPEECLISDDEGGPKGGERDREADDDLIDGEILESIQERMAFRERAISIFQTQIQDLRTSKAEIEEKLRLAEANLRDLQKDPYQETAETEETAESG